MSDKAHPRPATPNYPEKPDSSERRYGDYEQVNGAMVNALMDENAELRRDKARLDWVFAHCTIEHDKPLGYQEGGKHFWDREQIDAAIRDSQTGSASGEASPPAAG